MDCIPFQPSEFQPDNNHLEPEYIVAGLQLCKLTNCYLNDTGYCDVMDCYSSLSPYSTSTPCSAIKLLVNMYRYLSDQLNCTIQTASADTENASYVVSKQSILFEIYSSGDISHVHTDSTQTMNAQITLISMSSAQTQSDMTTLISTSIQNILDYIQKNPETYQDPTSLAIINAMTTNTTINQVVSSACSRVLNVIFQESLIHVYLNNVQFQKARIKIDQTSAIELMSQSIAISTINETLNQLFNNTFSNQIAKTFPIIVQGKKPVTVWKIVAFIIIILLIIAGIFALLYLTLLLKKKEAPAQKKKRK